MQKNKSQASSKKRWKQFSIILYPWPSVWSHIKTGHKGNVSPLLFWKVPKICWCPLQKWSDLCPEVSGKSSDVFPGRPRKGKVWGVFSLPFPWWFSGRCLARSVLHGCQFYFINYHFDSGGVVHRDYLRYTKQFVCLFVCLTILHCP